MRDVWEEDQRIARIREERSGGITSSFSKLRRNSLYLKCCTLGLKECSFLIGDGREKSFGILLDHPNLFLIAPSECRFLR